MKIYVEEGRQVRLREFSEAVVQIGRGPSNQLVINDPRSSRDHCRILATPHGFFVEDLKSRNGTFLNGGRIEKSALKPGDVLQIGRTRFHFESPPAERSSGTKLAQPAAGGAGPAAGAASSPGAAGGILEEAVTVESAAVSAAESDVLSPADVYLEGLGGEHEGKRVPITKIPYAIGRHPDNDLRIEDQKVSGHHARIVRRGKVFTLEDLESKNGTLVNGRRIRECPLMPGVRIQIGESQYRAQVPMVEGLDARTLAGVPADGDEAVEEEAFARLNVQKFLKETERPAQPLAAVVLLLILGTIAFFSIRLTIRLVERKDLDPSPRGNAIMLNWSFEDEPREDGTIPGWSAPEADGGSLRLAAGTGVREPGRRALVLTAAPIDVGLVRATCTQDLPVDRGIDHYLSGHAVNQGVMAAGLMVSWLRRAASGLEEIDRSFAGSVRLAGEEDTLRGVFRAPANAEYAQVSCFVLTGGGRGGSAIFDQVYFGAEPPPGFEVERGAPPEPAGEEDPGISGREPPAVPAAASPDARKLLVAATAATAGIASEAPIQAELRLDGSLAEIRRGRPLPVAACLWPGLPPSADPLGLGPRLAYEAGDPAREGSERRICHLPDVPGGEWYQVEAQVEVAGGEIVSRYRFHRSAGSERKLPDRAAIYLELPENEPEWSATGDQGTVQPGAGSPAQEIILGQGAEQVVLRFSPPVSIEALPPERGRRRALIVGTAALSGEKTRDLEVVVSPSSRREEAAMQDLLSRARALRLEGKLGEGLSLLGEIRRRYPWRRQGLARVDELEKEWLEEANRSLKILEADLEILRQFPSPLIYHGLLARAGEILDRHRGTPAAAALEQFLARARGQWEEQDKARRNHRLRELFHKGEEHYRSGRIYLAELYLLEVKQASGADPETLQSTVNLLDAIARKMEGKAALAGP